MRKSEAKDLICPKCNQQTLIKAGKTTPNKGSSKSYQRYRCTNSQCPLTITLKPKQAEKRILEVDADTEVLIIKRDAKGHFIKRGE
jgi:hypothetical protein